MIENEPTNMLYGRRLTPSEMRARYPERFTNHPVQCSQELVIFFSNLLTSQLVKEVNQGERSSEINRNDEEKDPLEQLQRKFMIASGKRGELVEVVICFDDLSYLGKLVDTRVKEEHFTSDETAAYYAKRLELERRFDPFISQQATKKPDVTAEISLFGRFFHRKKKI